MPIDKNSSMFLIHQMGKVGSAAIYRTLLDIFANDQRLYCFHSHSLNPGDSKIVPLERFADLRRVRDLAISSKILGMVQRFNTAGGKIKIIAGLRELVGHSLSAFFENIETHLPGFRDTDPEIAESFIKHIMRDGFAVIDIPTADTTTPSGTIAWNVRWARDWFDNELRDMFGIDVYAQPFNTKEGYVILRRGNVDAFIYRFDKLPALHKAIEAFCQPELKQPLALNHINTGDEKASAALYERMRKNLCLPAPTLHSLHTHKYYRHFFTPEEIDALTARYATRE